MLWFLTVGTDDGCARLVRCQFGSKSDSGGRTSMVSVANNELEVGLEVGYELAQQEGVGRSSVLHITENDRSRMVMTISENSEKGNANKNITEKASRHIERPLNRALYTPPPIPRGVRAEWP